MSAQYILLSGAEIIPDHLTACLEILPYFVRLHLDQIIIRILSLCSLLPCLHYPTGNENA